MRRIEILVRNINTSDNWNHLLVSDAFNPDLVRNCKFFGLVRIGKLEPYYLEFHNLRMPVGLYNSTIISCDIGDNVVVSNTNYLSHYIIGNEVMIVNVNELATTNTSKFGNGIIKQEKANQSGSGWNSATKTPEERYSFQWYVAGRCLDLEQIQG